AKGHNSKTQPQSHNNHKARHCLARAYLRVQRRREDCARKPARALASSHDVMAYEALQIRHLVRNHQLAQRMHDAAWGAFLAWVPYYANMPSCTTFQSSPCRRTTRLKPVRTVAPPSPSKTLSTRTHVCVRCGLLLDRDEHAARTILALACASG